MNCTHMSRKTPFRCGCHYCATCKRDLQQCEKHALGRKVVEDIDKAFARILLPSAAWELC